MSRVSKTRQAATIAGIITLGAIAPVTAAPGDLTDFFNDGFISQSEWLRINPATMTIDPTPVWQPFFGSDGATFASAVNIEEDPRRGLLRFNAATNRQTNSWNGYLANGWMFDPSLVGNGPMNMSPPMDPSDGSRFSSLADDAMPPFAEDDPEFDSLPATFSFSVEARFADRRPPLTIDNGAKNGLSICVTPNPGVFIPPSGAVPLGFIMPGDMGYDSPIDRQFLGNNTGAGGFEVFIENDNQLGLNIGIRPAGSFPGGAQDVSMRLEQGEKFDGRINITYTNDNMNDEGDNNRVTVSFVTKQGQIFFGELDGVFAETGFIEDTDAELRMYFSTVRPSVFIGAVSVMPDQSFNAKQSYFDNFVVNRLTNHFDGNPAGTPVDTDLDGDGDTDAVDVASALASAIPVPDSLLRAILLQTEPSLNPDAYLKDRQYFRAVGRWYKDNVIPVFAGQRSGKEKRADRRRLKGLRDIF